MTLAEDACVEAPRKHLLQESQSVTVRRQRPVRVIVFMHYVRIIKIVTMTTRDVLLRHSCEMSLTVGIHGCTLSYVLLVIVNP